MFPLISIFTPLPFLILPLPFFLEKKHPEYTIFATSEEEVKRYLSCHNRHCKDIPSRTGKITGKGMKF